MLSLLQQIKNLTKKMTSSQISFHLENVIFQWPSIMYEFGNKLIPFRIFELINFSKGGAYSERKFYIERLFQFKFNEATLSNFNQDDF